LLFGTAGAIYGAALALDVRSGKALGDHRLLRTILSGILGAAVVLIVWSWHPENFDPLWAISGVVVGGIAGWFGWSWARYVKLH
jgi:hypothetical protein